MKKLLIEIKRTLNQKSIVPSPFLPQTTIAIEKVNTAAKAAHAKVQSIIYMQGTIGIITHSVLALIKKLK